MSLIKDYFEKTQKHIEDYGELTIVLMQVGAFFEVYGLKMSDNAISGSNIVGFSRICDLNVVDKKASLDGVPIVMAGFKDHLLDKYLKKLQDAGYTIAVYEQDESCARHLTGVYSPGTYFSCDNDYDHITNNTCCVWIETKKRFAKGNNNSVSPIYIYVGASVVDIYTGVTTIMEYSEVYIKNPATFDDLERFISIYKPSEAIIISNLLAEDVADIVSFTNIKSKTIHVVSLLEPNNRNTLKALNCEKQVYQTELLNKFYRITDIGTFMGVFNENVYATQSFCYLLDFIYQHNPNLIYKIEEPVIENNNKNLILANHSLKQLNIIDDENYRGKYSSVSKMLNECITSMGKRRFTHQFLNPVFDEEYLQNEYNITEHLIDVSNNTGTNTSKENSPIVKAILNEITDMSKIMRQICLQKVSPKAIYQLFVSICACQKLYDFVKTDLILFSYLEKKVPSCDILLDKMNSIYNYLQNVLNLDECKEIENVYKIEKSFIREGVDANLDLKIKSLMDSQDQLEACRCYLNSIIENYEKGAAKGSKTKKNVAKNTDLKDDDAKSYVRIHETEKNNFSLIATDRRCKIVKEVIKAQKSAVLKYKSTFLGEETQFTLALDFQFDKQSSTNNTISTSQIDGLAKNLSTVKISLVDEVARVYQNVVKQLQTFQDELNNIVQFVTYLDLAYAKAYIAVKYNYCKPEIANTNTKKSFVKATSLRHCLIEKIQQSELYIANDICLGLGTNTTNINLDTNLDGILLYGTNAVGKTSFIKSIGIAVIMAQAGLFVAASAFKFKPYKYIFTRILGNDNLFKGLSTFAVEMSEFRTILRLANENSLVLGDELCSGTENPSAVSIFVAGIQALNTAQCSFIFATHFHEVAQFEEIRSLHNVGMKHMSVIYDKELDCLVYDRQLKDGRGTNMYGLEVCKSLSLPADFLENAYNIRMKYFAEGKTSVLEQKVSHYNAKHIAKGLCQKCGLAAAVDVHHLQHQKDANDKGFISDDKTTFDKNAAANLVNLCEACHDAIHKDTTGKKYKKTKTSKGVKLLGGT